MPEYKYDPEKPGITAELFEQHHRNAQRPGEGFTHPPGHHDRAGEIGRQMRSGWHEHAVFIAGDKLAFLFLAGKGEGFKDGKPSYSALRNKRKFHLGVANDVREMLTPHKFPGETLDGLTIDGVRKVLERHSALLNEIFAERILVRKEMQSEAPD